MKTILLLLACSISLTSASQLSLRAVSIPLYVLNTDDGAGAEITDVPYVSRGADPEWRFSAISTPFTPPHDGQWHSKADINLVSLYQIKVTGGQVQGTPNVEAIVDLSEAKAPEGYPYTIEEVKNYAIKCINLMHPETALPEGKFTIKVIGEKTEQVPASE